MTATQGQNYAAGIRALGLRSGVADDDVRAAVERAEIVRCWPQRGTLHFVPAEDATWLMKLGNPRVEAAAANRRSELGLTPELVAAARKALHDALMAAGPSGVLTRPECYEVFANSGIDPAEGRGPHLLRAFGGVGEVVQGPLVGKTETFVHVDHLPHPRSEPGDPAAESARRYTLSHGPVTAKDFSWWSGLTVTVSKKALATAAMSDDVMQHGNYFMGSWQERVTEEELDAALALELHLPAFDEYLLGYSAKSFALADELRHRVLTKNGISWPFVVRDGVALGREGDEF